MRPGDVDWLYGPLATVGDGTGDDVAIVTAPDVAVDNDDVAMVTATAVASDDTETDDLEDDGSIFNICRRADAIGGSVAMATTTTTMTMRESEPASRRILIEEIQGGTCCVWQCV